MASFSPQKKIHIIGARYFSRIVVVAMAISMTDVYFTLRDHRNVVFRLKPQVQLYKYDTVGTPRLYMNEHGIYGDYTTGSGFSRSRACVEYSCGDHQPYYCSIQDVIDKRSDIFFIAQDYTTGANFNYRVYPFRKVIMRLDTKEHARPYKYTTDDWVIPGNIDIDYDDVFMKSVFFWPDGATEMTALTLRQFVAMPWPGK